MRPVSWLRLEASAVPPGNAWLTANERLQEAALRFPKRRADWRLGRWVAKRALALMRGEDADPVGLVRLEIRASPRGAPEAYCDSAPLPYVVSISHSRGRGLAAVASAATSLGCDIEAIEPRSRAFVEDYFTQEERARVESCRAGDAPFLATLIWSAKESAMKALGEGLRIATQSVLVTPDPRKPADSSGWATLRVAHSSSATVFAGYWRRVDGHVLTLVAAPDPALPRELLAHEAGGTRPVAGV